MFVGTNHEWNILHVTVSEVVISVLGDERVIPMGLNHRGSTSETHLAILTVFALEVWFLVRSGQTGLDWMWLV